MMVKMNKMLQLKSETPTTAQVLAACGKKKEG